MNLDAKIEASESTMKIKKNKRKEGTILNSCSACMYINGKERLDLFVSGKDYAIDRGYKGNNSGVVLKEEK